MKLRLSSGAFLAIVVVTCCAWLAFYSRGAIAREAHHLMEREVERGHFSGAVLMSRDGHVIFAHAYGMANAEENIPNTLQTRFRIGSITKTFTAILVMQLEGEHRIALTDPVCSYLDECPPGWADITLHHLLSHTSGIFNYTRVDHVEDYLVSHQAPGEVFARIAREPLAFAPGTRFEYSNSNFRLLSRVIEKVTGHSYEDALRQRIFEPAGMHDTGLTHDWPKTPHAATGYWITRQGKLERAPVVDGSWSSGDGGIYSTVGDLEKFSDALDSEKLLPRATLERMWTPVREVYGYGWSTPQVSRLTFNRRVVDHGGALPGFLSRFQRVVDEHLTLIVLSNNQRSSPPRVAQVLGSVALGEKFVPSYEREVAQVSGAVLQRFAGDYDIEGTLWTLFVRDGRLFARTQDSPELELLPESETTFFLRDVEGDVTAVQNSKGDVTGVMLGLGDSSRLARKVR